MSLSNINRNLLCTGLLLLIGSAAQAGESGITLNVQCGASRGLNSIGAALKILKNSETRAPGTINVSGTCNENVVIQGMDRVTLNAATGASINDASQGAAQTIWIDDSRGIAINNFTINGNAASTGSSDVVDLTNGSMAHFTGDTVQNAPQGGGGGLGVFSGSYVRVDGGFLQNNTSWVGLAVFNSGRAVVVNATLQANWRGALVAQGGHLQFASSTSTNNTDAGIELRQGSALVCNQCTVTTNGSQGINAEESSVATVYNGPTVTGNTGAGVNLTNLSSATFDGTGTVNGNNSGRGDIVCNPKYTTTAGLPGTVGQVVNCP
jgi:hypothetical protein